MVVERLSVVVVGVVVTLTNFYFHSFLIIMSTSSKGDLFVSSVASTSSFSTVETTTTTGGASASTSSHATSAFLTPAVTQSYTQTQTQTQTQTTPVTVPASLPASNRAMRIMMNPHVVPKATVPMPPPRAVLHRQASAPSTYCPSSLPEPSPPSYAVTHAAAPSVAAAAAVAVHPPATLPPQQPQQQQPPPPPPQQQKQQQQQTTSSSISPPSLPSLLPCRVCGINVPMVFEQVEAARRKLELWQEKISLEEQLLKSDKHNFKKRLKAFKSSQVALNNKVQQLQVEREQWERHCRHQQHEHDERAAAVQQQLAHYLDDQHAWRQRQALLERQVESLRQQQRQLELEKKELVAYYTSKSNHPNNNNNSSNNNNNHQSNPLPGSEPNDKDTNDTTTSPTNDSHAALQAAHEKIQQLQAQLEDKQTQMESYEMQLLELERALDEQMNQTDARKNQHDDDDHHHHQTNDTLSCPRCTRLNQQLVKQKREAQQLQQQVEACHAQLVELSNEARTTTPRPTTESSWQAQLEERNQQISDWQASNAQLQQEVIRLKAHEQEQQSKLNHLTQQVNQLQMNGTNGSTDAASTVNQESSSNESVQVASQGSADPTNRRLVMEMDYNGPPDQQPDYLIGGGKYTGMVDTVSQLPDGSGTFRCDDGNVIDGDWHRGKPHGHAVLATIDGDVYRGEWKDGRKHGSGCFIFTDGRVYRGEYCQDQRHGQGILTWPYGAHYTGSFAHDKRNGTGEYHYPDGRVYKGHYKDDRPDGYGVLSGGDGQVIYDGNWELGEFLNDSKDSSGNSKK